MWREKLKIKLKPFGKWFITTRFRIIIVSSGILVVGYFLFFFLPLWGYKKCTHKDSVVIRPFEVILEDKASPETGRLLASLLAINSNEENKVFSYEVLRIFPLPGYAGFFKDEDKIKEEPFKAHYERAALGYLSGVGDTKFEPGGIPVVKLLFELERFRKRELLITGIFSRKNEEWEGTLHVGAWKPRAYFLSCNGGVKNLVQELASCIAFDLLQFKRPKGEAAEFKKFSLEDFKKYYIALRYINVFLEECKTDWERLGAESAPVRFLSDKSTFKENPPLLSALKILEDLHESSPQSALVLNALGVVNFYLGETDTAEKQLAEAGNINYYLAPVHHNLGVIHLGKSVGTKEREIAVEQLERAYTLEPSRASKQAYQQAAQSL